MATKNILVDLDLNDNQALNLVLQNAASDPAAVDGKIYYNTTDNKVFFYDGTVWQDMSGDVDTINGTAPIQASNVSGVVTISIDPATTSAAGSMSAADKQKLDNATSTNTASTIVQRDASGNFGANNITANLVTGLATPSAGTDAANKQYVDDQIANLPEIGTFVGGYDASGGAVPQVGTGTGGDIVSGDFWVINVGGTITGIGTLNAGDVLFADSDVATGTAVAGDFFAVESNRDQATETTLGLVEIATQAETDAGTDDQRAITPAKLAGYVSSQSIPAGYSQTGVSIGTTPGLQTITHNLGTRNVVYSVYDATTYEEYEVEVIHATTNTITIDANGPTRTVDVAIIGF